MTLKFLRLQMTVPQNKILSFKRNLLVFNLERKRKIQMKFEIHSNFLNQKLSMSQSTHHLLLERLKHRQTIKLDNQNALHLNIFVWHLLNRQKLTNKHLNRRENHFNFCFQNVVIAKEVLNDELELKEKERNSSQIQFHHWKKSTNFLQSNLQQIWLHEE